MDYIRLKITYFSPQIILLCFFLKIKPWRSYLIVELVCIISQKTNSSDTMIYSEVILSTLLLNLAKLFLCIKYSTGANLVCSSYPEEENTCCIFFTSFEPMKRINIIKLNDISRRPTFPLVMQENEQKDRELGHLAADHSAWILTVFLNYFKKIIWLEHFTSGTIYCCHPSGYIWCFPSTEVMYSCYQRNENTQVGFESSGTIGYYHYVGK